MIVERVWLESTYPDDDSFRGVSDDGKSRVATMSLQTDDQIEKTLIRIRFAFLAHVIGRRLVEMESTDCDLGHFILLQFHAN